MPTTTCLHTCRFIQSNGSEEFYLDFWDQGLVERGVPCQTRMYKMNMTGRKPDRAPGASVSGKAQAEKKSDHVGVNWVVFSFFPTYILFSYPICSAFHQLSVLRRVQAFITVDSECHETRFLPQIRDICFFPPSIFPRLDARCRWGIHAILRGQD